MQDRLALLSFLLVFSLSATVRADDIPAPIKSDPATIQKLIDNLGSSSFSERDQASKTIEAIGAPALPLLRKVAEDKDQEVICRAARLVQKLEEKVLTQAYLTARRVHLKVNDLSVLDAVTELQKLSGQQLDITGDRTGLMNRKITLDTGNVTVWEALQQLCQKGGMSEQVNVPNRNQPPMPVYRVPAPVQPNQNRNIVLVDAKGTPPALPTSLNGSVRVRALPANSVPATNGELHVVLEAVGEQRLQNFGVVDALFFDKATDDQGQRLELIPENPFANQNMNFNNGFNRIMIVNGNVVPFGGASALLHRTMVFRFKPGAKGATILKELSGKLILEALSPPEPLITIKDVRQAAGQTARGKAGNAIQVVSVENLGNGALKLQLVLESVPEGNTAQNAFGNNVMVLNGNFNGNINGVQFINGVPANNMPTNYPKLVDAKGKKYAPEVNLSRPEFNNGQILRHATLTYRPEGQANQLVLEGQRSMHFAVPINLKDIPLR